MTDLVAPFARRLSGLGLRYMITGSVASTLYGEPRLTHDVDVVVELAAAQIAALIAAFEPDAYYLPPEEVILVECARSSRGHFNVIDVESGFKADVYLVGDDPLHRWALERVRLIAVGEGDEELTLPVAPPEYVIVRKLEFYREGGSAKHLDDIRGILAGEHPPDPDELGRWIERRGLGEAWRQVAGDGTA